MMAAGGKLQNHLVKKCLKVFFYKKISKLDNIFQSRDKYKGGLFFNQSIVVIYVSAKDDIPCFLSARRRCGSTVLWRLCPDL